MTSSIENRYLHCATCVNEKTAAGMAVFVTPAGDLGIQCMKHGSFVMVIPNDKLSEHFIGVSMQLCGNHDCEREEVGH